MCWLINVLIGSLVCLVGWLVGTWVGWLAGWLVYVLASCAGWSVSWAFGQLVVGGGMVCYRGGNAPFFSS